MIECLKLLEAGVAAAAVPPTVPLKSTSAVKQSFPDDEGEVVGAVARGVERLDRR